MALPMRVERGLSTADVVHQELNNMLGRFFGGGLFPDRGDGGGFAALANFGVDIREDEDHVYLEADLPGFRKEDVDITLESGMLTISAERREEPQGEEEREGERRSGRQGQGRRGGSERDGNYLLQERRYQRYFRSFTLPPNVNESDVQAQLDNGVLCITLTKREEAKPRRISVS